MRRAAGAITRKQFYDYARVMSECNAWQQDMILKALQPIIDILKPFQSNEVVTIEFDHAPPADTDIRVFYKYARETRKNLDKTCFQEKFRCFKKSLVP